MEEQKWTTVVPSKEGWYWTIFKGSSEASMRCFELHELRNKNLTDLIKYYSGQILPPPVPNPLEEKAEEIINAIFDKHKCHYAKETLFDVKIKIIDILKK